MVLTEKIKELDDKLYGEISEAIKDQKFKPIIKNGVWIGFLTWQEKWKDSQRHIFIRNMFIDEKYRSKENLLFLRNFFRKLYKNDFRFVFWHNGKKNRFAYGHP